MEAVVARLRTVQTAAATAVSQRCGTSSFDSSCWTFLCVVNGSPAVPFFLLLGFAVVAQLDTAQPMLHWTNYHDTVVMYVRF